jgi:uncharacterized protein YndB with AHSA1/START domain
MSTRRRYSPGPAAGARIEKQAAQWTLVLVRDLRHPPARVWEAITAPEHLREWAPFDADRSLGQAGRVKLSPAGAPSPMVSDSQVTRAEAPRLLEFTWGAQNLRWELEPREGGGTRLTLWHNIDRGFIAMGAAGWHVCFDVLSAHLDGDPLGRLVGVDAMKFEGWQRLHAEYGQQFGTRTQGAP